MGIEKEALILHPPSSLFRFQRTTVLPSTTSTFTDDPHTPRTSRQRVDSASDQVLLKGRLVNTTLHPNNAHHLLALKQAVRHELASANCKRSLALQRKRDTHEFANTHVCQYKSIGHELQLRLVRTHRIAAAYHAGRTSR